MPDLAKFPLILCLVAASCFSLSAQSGNAALIVSLTDQAGNIVVEGDVRIIQSGKVESNAKTNNDGSAAFRGLSGGEYQIVVAVPGFKEYKSDVISLKSGEVRKLEIALELGVIETQVDVNENEAADSTRDGSTRDLEKEQIDELPTDPEEMRRVLQALAGQSADGSEMPITVNGVPGAAIPSKENIKLVRINRNVFSAQYENTYGGGIEIYTNSDVKKLSGYGGVNYGNSRFNASDPFIGRRVPFTTRRMYFGLGGPLRRNATLFVNMSHSKSDTSAVVNAVVVGPGFQIIDLRQSYAVPSRSNSFDVTLDADPNKKHKIFFNYRMWFGNTQNSGVGGLTLADRATNTRNTEIVMSLSHTFIINPDFINVSRFRSWLSKNRTLGDIASPAITVSEAFLGGGSQADREASNLNYEIYNDTTRKVGRFSIGFGAMLRRYKLSEVSRSNFGGTYTFTGRIAPVLDADNQPVRDPSGNIVTARISSIESYRRTLLLGQLGYSTADIRLLGGGADQLSIAGGRPDIGVSQMDYAVYQQNSYGISETLGVSFGVRYENQTNIRSGFNLAPRVGLIWSPKAKEKQRPITTLPRVTFGVGMFYSRFSINNILSERQANDSERAFYFITDGEVLDSFPMVPTTTTLQQSSALRSLRLIDAGLQTPRSNIINFSLTKRIWLNFSLTANLFHSRGYRQAVSRNINAPLGATAVAVPIYPLGNSRSVYETRSEARADWDRISVYLNPPQFKLWGKTPYFYLAYTFARARGNVTSGSSSPLDPYDFSREWGPNPQDGVHGAWGYFGVPLPYNFFVRGDLNIRSGSRFNIITGRDTNRDGFYSERPAFASDANKPGVIMTPYGLLDPSPGPDDNIIPRNLGRASGGADFNLYLSKSFGFNRDKAKKNTPRQRLSLHINFNNVLNINNKGLPIGNMSSTNFLRSVTNSRDGNFGPSNPRRINFGTSFSF